MRRISHQCEAVLREPARDKTPEPQHVALKDWPRVQRGPRNARLQGLPQLLLCPALRIRFRVALEVHALHRGAALTDEREALLGVRVDEFVRTRRGLAQHPEPCEGVLAEI